MYRAVGQNGGYAPLPEMEKCPLLGQVFVDPPGECQCPAGQVADYTTNQCVSPSEPQAPPPSGAPSSKASTAASWLWPAAFAVGIALLLATMKNPARTADWR